MQRRVLAFLLGAAVVLPAPGASAQTFPTEDPVLRQIWHEGMENSHTYPLAQVLMDSIGPRLTGAAGLLAANEWTVAQLKSWGIDARKERYGTWRGWRRGASHIDLVEPRVRSLEGMMLAWSPGTEGKVRGGVVVLPDVADGQGFEAWLPQVTGKFVLISYPQPTCRPDANWEEYATPASFESMKAVRDSARRAWRERLQHTGLDRRELPRRLEAAGAAGVVTSTWASGWGADRVFSASTEHVPTFDIGCEDYGLVYRLAANGQGPVLEVEAQAEFTGDAPLFNTVGTIRGGEKPEEYVVLSAHLDSWDGGSGATDNGTGSVTMLEAMRILKQVYPNPKRTVLIGLWASEEQGLNGSRAFATDHPEVLDGMQALFNQDNGTGRVVNISMQGLTHAGEFFARWMTQLPQEFSQQIDLGIPGTPSGGGTDHASFICAGAPAFGLFSNTWDYFTYTWHTNRDTFDKLVFDDLRSNATLVAMLAYLASEEPDRIPRDRRVLPLSRRTGEQMTWPECRDGQRSWENR